MSHNTDALMQELLRWSTDKRNSEKDKGWRSSFFFSGSFLLGIAFVAILVIIIGVWWWMSKRQTSAPAAPVAPVAKPVKQPPDTRRRPNVAYVTPDGKSVSPNKVRS